MEFDTQVKLAVYSHFAETGQRTHLEVANDALRALYGKDRRAGK